MCRGETGRRQGGWEESWGWHPRAPRPDEPYYSLTRACPRLGPHGGAEQRCWETGLSWAELSLPCCPGRRDRSAPCGGKPSQHGGGGGGWGWGCGKTQGMTTRCAEPVLRARPRPLLCAPEKAPARSGPRSPANKWAAQCQPLPRLWGEAAQSDPLSSETVAQGAQPRGLGANATPPDASRLNLGAVI